MNWYKISKEIVDDESLTDMIFHEWKNSSFEANVNSIIQRIYQIGMPADSKRKEISEKVLDVVKELSSEDGELKLWKNVIKDIKYFHKIKNAVSKRYKKKVEEIERAKRGPLQINTPQTPSAPPGGGGGGGGMLM